MTTTPTMDHRWVRNACDCSWRRYQALQRSQAYSQESDREKVSFNALLDLRLLNLRRLSAYLKDKES